MLDDSGNIKPPLARTAARQQTEGGGSEKPGQPRPCEDSFFRAWWFRGRRWNRPSENINSKGPGVG